MSRKSESSEKTKKIILAVLLLVMVAVAAYQLFLSEPTPKKRPQPTAAPGLPQRTRGAQEMPGQPIEKTDEGGGWFTKKDSSSDPDKA